MTIQQQQLQLRENIATSSLGLNMTSSMPSSNPGRDEELAKVEVTVQALILIVTVCGNGLVLVSLVLRRKHLTRMDIMMVHLASADLFVACFNVLPQLIWDVTFRFRGGDLLCRPVKYLQVVAMYASSYVLVSTAIDRWLAICRPLTTHVAWSTTKTHALVAVAWLLALIFALPQVFIFSWTMTSSGMYDCWGDFDTFAWSMPAYVTAITCAIYVVPAAILIVTYASICCAVWRSVHGREGGARSTVHSTSCHSTNMLLTRTRSIRSTSSQDRVTPATLTSSMLAQSQCYEFVGSLSSSRKTAVSAPLSPRQQHHILGGGYGGGGGGGGAAAAAGGVEEPPSPAAHLPTSRPLGTLTRAKVKTVKLTLTVITCYIVCWGPFFTVQMWRAWDPAMNTINHGAVVIILLLASLNSCVNPWIFVAFSGLDSLEECCRYAISRGLGDVTRGRGLTATGVGGGGTTGEDIALKTRLMAAAKPTCVTSATNGSRASYGQPVTSQAYDDDTTVY